VSKRLQFFTDQTEVLQSTDSFIDNLQRLFLNGVSVLSFDMSQAPYRAWQALGKQLAREMNIQVSFHSSACKFMSV
jgi:hypothetical protein